MASADEGYIVPEWSTRGASARRRAAMARPAQAEEPEPFDYYAVPEWQRRDAFARARGERPQQSMEEISNANPEGWYSIPEWQRTDLLRSRGFGIQTDEEKQADARRQMLQAQTGESK